MSKILKKLEKYTMLNDEAWQLKYELAEELREIWNEYKEFVKDKSQYFPQYVEEISNLAHTSTVLVRGTYYSGGHTDTESCEIPHELVFGTLTERKVFLANLKSRQIKDETKEKATRIAYLEIEIKKLMT